MFQDNFRTGNQLQLVARSSGRTLQIVTAPDGQIVPDGNGLEGPQVMNGACVSPTAGVHRKQRDWLSDVKFETSMAESPIGRGFWKRQGRTDVDGNGLCFSSMELSVEGSISSTAIWTVTDLKNNMVTLHNNLNFLCVVNGQTQLRHYVSPGDTWEGGCALRYLSGTCSYCSMYTLVAPSNAVSGVISVVMYDRQSSQPVEDETSTCVLQPATNAVGRETHFRVIQVQNNFVCLESVVEPGRHVGVLNTGACASLTSTTHPHSC